MLLSSGAYYFYCAGFFHGAKLQREAWELYEDKSDIKDKEQEPLVYKPMSCSNFYQSLTNNIVSYGNAVLIAEFVKFIKLPERNFANR